MAHKKLKQRKNKGRVVTCPKCGGRVVRRQYDKTYVFCDGLPGRNGCGWFKE